jgi:hypothetical protein
MPKPRDVSGHADRARLAITCEGALDELLSERAAARPGDRRRLDDQIETCRDMLRWARSKH